MLPKNTVYQGMTQKSLYMVLVAKAKLFRTTCKAIAIKIKPNPPIQTNPSRIRLIVKANDLPTRLIRVPIDSKEDLDTLLIEGALIYERIHLHPVETSHPRKPTVL